MVRNHIEIHEDKFVFFQKKSLRHFNEYSNSCHEGTNKALKFEANEVGPTMLLHNSASRLTQQGKIRYKKFCIRATKQTTKTHVWCTPFQHMSKLIVSRGLFLLTEEHNEYDKYENLKISDNSWLVRMKGNLDDLRQSTLFNVHPIYSRIRTVTVHNSILKCSCKMFERVGLICRHMFNVMSSLHHYSGPTYHDNSVYWWSNYLSNAGNNSTLSQGLMKLYEKDIPGPRIRSFHHDSITPSVVVPDDWKYDQKLPKVKNFNIPLVKMMNIMKKGEIPFGVSQLSSQIEQINDDSSEVTSDTEKDIISPCFDMENLELKPEEIASSLSPFQFLYPSFKEMCSTAENCCDKDRLIYMKKWLDTEVTENLRLAVTIEKKKKHEYNEGTYISSALSNSKKRKTHGTNR